jgi:hypothetical protein
MLIATELQAGKNPRRVAAGQRNGRLRRPWTPEDRARQRQNCLERKPWEQSTGPKSLEGKRRAAFNGRRNLPQSGSRQDARRSVADVHAMIASLQDLRATMGRCPP